MAHSSQDRWNFQSDKNNGSIFCYNTVRPPYLWVPYLWVSHSRIQSKFPSMVESEDVEDWPYLWYYDFLYKGLEHLQILVSLGAPETDLPPYPGITVFGLLSSVPETLQSKGEVVVLLFITSPFLPHLGLC